MGNGIETVSNITSLTNLAHIWKMYYCKPMYGCVSITDYTLSPQFQQGT